MGCDFLKNEKVIGSVIFLIISGLFFVLSMDFPTVAVTTDVGPAFMPRMYTVFLALLSIVLLIQGIKEKIKKEKYSITNYENIGLVLIIMALTVVYVFLIPYLGFYLVSLIFIITFLFISRVKKLWTILFVSIFTNVFVFVFFEKLLAVPIPVGMLFS